MHDPATPSSALVFVSLLIAAVRGAYIRAARRRPHWSLWRTLSFTGGCVLLLAAFSASAVHWAHADLRGHTLQPLLLGTFAPFVLVLAAPVTLLLASVGANTARRTILVLHRGTGAPRLAEL